MPGQGVPRGTGDDDGDADEIARRTSSADVSPEYENQNRNDELASSHAKQATYCPHHEPGENGNRDAYGALRCQ